MYTLQPERLFALPELLSDPLTLARLDSLLKGVGRTQSDLTLLTPESLPEALVALSRQPDIKCSAGALPAERRRSLVFTRLRFGDQEPDLAGLMQHCPEGTDEELVRGLFGYRKSSHERRHCSDREPDHVCWSAWEYMAVWGCSHGCRYCGAGRNGTHLTLGLNLEEYAHQVVIPDAHDNPWQKCFRLIGGGADPLTFEPEYGAYEVIARALSVFPDRYLITYTASDNVYWLADFPFKDRLIHAYSLTSPGLAEHFEPCTPTPVERLQAAAFVEDLGIPTRPMLKPIIPHRDWRDSYEQIIANLFAQTHPEAVDLAVLMRMDYATLAAAINLDLLDPCFVEAMQQAEAELQGATTGPFPYAARAEIYRFLIQQIRRWDKNVPIHISSESRQMWEELEEELGHSQQAFPGALSLSPEMMYTT